MSSPGEAQRVRLGELMLQSHESYSACGLGAHGTDLIVKLVRAAGTECWPVRRKDYRRRMRWNGCHTGPRGCGKQYRGDCGEVSQLYRIFPARFFRLITWRGSIWYTDRYDLDLEAMAEPLLSQEGCCAKRNGVVANAAT